jgi:hypothetical protein
MNKHIHLFIFFSFGFCLQCFSQSTQSVVGLKNNQLKTVLEDYFKMNIRDLKAGVIIVKMTQSKDTINYKISSTLSNIDIDQKTPSFYVFNNRTPILFYVGLEGDFVFSSEYRNRLKKILKPFLIAYKEDANGKILSLAPNYNPVIWEIKMINQKIIYQKR